MYKQARKYDQYSKERELDGHQSQNDSDFGISLKSKKKYLLNCGCLSFIIECELYKSRNLISSVCCSIPSTDKTKGCIESTLKY